MAGPSFLLTRVRASFSWPGLPGLWCLAVLGLLVQGGCINVDQLISAFNTPPQILLMSPSPGEDGAAVDVPELEGLLFTVQVADAEDLSEELLVRWFGVRTDAGASQDDDPDDGGGESPGDEGGDDDDSAVGDGNVQELGEAHPDSTGWLEFLVVGLGPGAWRVTAEVMDSDGATAEVGLNIVVGAANEAPSIVSVELGDEPAYESTVLLCDPIGWNDPEDSSPGYQVAWFVDHEELEGPESSCDGDDEPCKLDGTWFDRGDDVTCALTPDDGELLGESVTSNTVTILNSPPGAPGVVVSPSPSAQQDDELICSVTGEAEDLDGDPMLVPDDYEVLWYLDGAPAPDHDGSWSIAPSATELGQEWICEVRASDGTELGEPGQASTTILPLDGDLVISEFHAAPGSVADAAGEWVELFNASLSNINLLGFELLDDDEDSHVILDDLVLPPGVRVVLGRNADFASNGGVLVEYEYTGFVLDNDSDEIVLAFDGVEVDRVVYDLSPYGDDALAHSLSLDPSLGVPDSEINDNADHWCLAGVPLGSLDGDFGTPGGPNSSCACFESDGDGDGWGDDLTCAPVDCDDEDESIHPAAEELCENGIDENCDAMDAVCACLDTDDDGDGYGDGLGCVDVDCNDDPAAGGLDTYPGAPELCDGEDNDCNGLADAGSPGIADQEFDADGDGDRICHGDCDDGDALLNLADNDADGHSTCSGDCDDADAQRHSMLAEACDGIDNDCDGLVPVDETDDDGDGFVECVYTGTDPLIVGGEDCDDSLALRYPGLAEACDGLDNDCDLIVPPDEADDDLDGYRLCEGDCDDGDWTLIPEDDDGDGYSSCAGDCDDADALRHPGLLELCDGLDNDCDLVVPPDETDDDGDGFNECDDLDCDDSNPAIHLSAIESCNGIDDDCDTIIPPDETDDDGDGFNECADGDCDDTDDTVYGSAPELCDGLDNQCGLSVPADEVDDDGDGYVECDYSGVDPTVLGGLDCDDGNPLRYPGFSEVCDGLDNDCDLVVPPDETDDDGDGFNECDDLDCDDSNPAIHLSAIESCNGIDDDCDTIIPPDETDDDGDGHNECADADCDDSDPSVFVLASELCDGLDNDCDTAIPGEELDDDGDGYVECTYVGVEPAILGGDDCDDSDPISHPDATEICDGFDNDCIDGVPADEADNDSDGYRICGGDCDDSNGALTLDDLDGDGYTTCAGDCDDSTALRHEFLTESCDGLDNDCDLVVPADESDDDLDGYRICDGDCNDSSAVLNLDDNDGDNYSSCSGDCDDTSIFRNPGLLEVCDGLDNDCEGGVDEDYDTDGDGWTLCGPDFNFSTTGDNDCDDGNSARNPGATEACDGIDNDCDYETDEQDALNCQHYFLDSDNDGYGIGASQCLCAPVGQLTAVQGGDCYDGNGNAYPGSPGTSWYGSHRGDFSYDYNCDFSETRRWTQQSGSCAFFSDFCGGGDGWRNGIPSCGNNGNWGNGCYYSTAGWPWDWGCYFNSSVSRTQQCH